MRLEDEFQRDLELTRSSASCRPTNPPERSGITPVPVRETEHNVVEDVEGFGAELEVPTLAQADVELPEHRKIGVFPSVRPETVALQCPEGKRSRNHDICCVEPRSVYIFGPGCTRITNDTGTFRICAETDVRDAIGRPNVIRRTGVQGDDPVESPTAHYCVGESVVQTFPLPIGRCHIERGREDMRKIEAAKKKVRFLPLWSFGSEMGPPKEAPNTFCLSGSRGFTLLASNFEK